MSKCTIDDVDFKDITDEDIEPIVDVPATKEEFDKAVEDAVASKKCAFIEVIVERKEEVLPMVPNGHALDEMILLEGDK